MGSDEGRLGGVDCVCPVFILMTSSRRLPRSFWGLRFGRNLLEERFERFKDLGD
jgi:hypothetical protein